MLASNRIGPLRIAPALSWALALAVWPGCGGPGASLDDATVTTTTPPAAPADAPPAPAPAPEDGPPDMK